MSVVRKPRPFRTPLLRLDRAALFAGLAAVESCMERASVAATPRERCVYEMRALITLRDTYREAGLVQGGAA